MTKMALTLFLVLFSTLPLFAQSLSVDTAWVRRYNGPGNDIDSALAISADNSGNIYVTGYSYGKGTGPDYATIKYYANGDTAWVRRYTELPDDYIDRATALAVDDSGNVCVTGYVYGLDMDDYATIKYFPNGDTAWVRKYNFGLIDRPSAIAVDAPCNVYVTGSSLVSPAYQYFDYATIKYFPNGDTAWVRRYDSPWHGNDRALAIAVDGSGNVYVTGSTLYECATIKYNPNGDTAWVRRFGGLSGSAIAVDDSGNAYVTGTANDDYLTLKYKSNGDVAWVSTYNGPGNGDDSASDIALDTSGYVYVTGSSPGSGTSLDYATIKYNPNGDTVWVRRYSGPGNGDDTASAIALDASGCIYVTGYSFSSGTSFDYATVKYNPDGDTVWVRRYNGSANNTDAAKVMAVDISGQVYVTGGSIGSGTGYDYATVKYVQFLRGDANSDKKVTVSDIVFLVSYLFKHGPTPNPIRSGDANCDGKVTVSDIVYLIAYLFKHGPAPCI